MKEPLLKSADPANDSRIIEVDHPTEDEKKIMRVLALEHKKNSQESLGRIGVIAVTAASLITGLFIWAAPSTNNQDKFVLPVLGSLLTSYLSIIFFGACYEHKDHKDSPFPKRHLEIAKELARKIKESQAPRLAQDNPGSQVAEPALSIQRNGLSLSSR